MVADRIPIPVIASGGVGQLSHLAEGILEGGADAVLAASIFHYGQYTIAEAKQAMAEAGIDVRYALAGAVPAQPPSRGSCRGVDRTPSQARGMSAHPAPPAADRLQLPPACTSEG